MLAISTTIQLKDVTPTFPLQPPHLDLARKDLYSNVIKAGIVYSDAQSRFSFSHEAPNRGFSLRMLCLSFDSTNDTAIYGERVNGLDHARSIFSLLSNERMKWGGD